MIIIISKMPYLTITLFTVQRVRLYGLEIFGFIYTYV